MTVTSIYRKMSMYTTMVAIATATATTTTTQLIFIPLAVTGNFPSIWMTKLIRRQIRFFLFFEARAKVKHHHAIWRVHASMSIHGKSLPCTILFRVTNVAWAINGKSNMCENGANIVPTTMAEEVQLQCNRLEREKNVSEWKKWDYLWQKCL